MYGTGKHSLCLFNHLHGPAMPSLPQSSVRNLKDPSLVPAQKYYVEICKQILSLTEYQRAEPPLHSHVPYLPSAYGSSAFNDGSYCNSTSTSLPSSSTVNAQFFRISFHSFSSYVVGSLAIIVCFPMPWSSPQIACSFSNSPESGCPGYFVLSVLPAVSDQ